MRLAEALDAVEGFLARFIIYPSPACKAAHALWIAHTHCMSAFDSTPRLAFLSPEPASGKTRALEITQVMCFDPILTANVSSAYVVRRVSGEESAPTLLIDEIDTIFGPKAGHHEDLRSVLNSGHRRGARVGRCKTVGKSIVTEDLETFAAVALAGLGALPDTIMTRSIVVRMKRRLPQEQVEPYRQRDHEPLGFAIRDRLAAICHEKLIARLAAARPDMPTGVADRDADVWEPLLAIADEAGGDWPERARAAAVELVTLAKAKPATLGIQLLKDVRSVFEAIAVDKLPTKILLENLVAMDDAPWGDYRGRAMTERDLSRLLKQYDICSRTHRFAEQVSAKGYAKVEFQDAWSRYLRA